MKKSIVLLVVAFIGLQTFAQQIDYSLERGYMVEGNDITEYFNNKVVEGNKNYTATHDGAKFKFASQANLDKFKANPGKYLPQYGGYCAYALATSSKKVDPDVETFEIRNGKLYLFYNSWGRNNKEKWLEDGPEKLIVQGDNNWKKVKYKN